MSVGRATNGLMTGQGPSGQICQHFQLHTSYRDLLVSRRLTAVGVPRAVENMDTRLETALSAEAAVFGPNSCAKTDTAEHEAKLGPEPIRTLGGCSVLRSSKKCSYKA